MSGGLEHLLFFCLQLICSFALSISKYLRSRAFGLELIHPRSFVYNVAYKVLAMTLAAK